MKLNSKIKIIGDKVVLVPYRKEHVKKYHKWMESELLRQQTASERLSLDEEFDMQQMWLNDEDKCTFIVLDKGIMEIAGNEVDSMIGDVNLYLRRDEETGLLEGEVGLMIAESSFRQSGRGFETSLFIIRYGIEQLNVKKFVALISQTNIESINLFQKLRFIEGQQNVFGEILFSKFLNDEWLTFILQNTKNYNIEDTIPNC